MGQGGTQHTMVPAWQLLIGGFFVAYGAHLSNGCTSGHGICRLGLVGVCPGPALAAIGAGNTDVLWALAGIACGALAQGLHARH